MQKLCDRFDGLVVNPHTLNSLRRANPVKTKLQTVPNFKVSATVIGCTTTSTVTCDVNKIAFTKINSNCLETLCPHPTGGK